MRIQYYTKKLNSWTGDARVDSINAHNGKPTDKNHVSIDNLVAFQYLPTITKKGKRKSYLSDATFLSMKHKQELTVILTVEGGSSVVWSSCQ